MSALIELFRSSSALYGGNAAFIEDLYERYLKDPESVDLAWRQRFDAMHREAANEIPHGPVRENFLRLATESRIRPTTRRSSHLEPAAAEKQAAVLRLINTYRYRGHQNADLDPLKLRERRPVADLDPSYHGLEAADMDQVFHSGSLYAPDRMRLADILDLVQDIYCRKVGSEYMHITSTQEKRWIQKRLEGYRARPELEPADRRWLLMLLTAAEGFETYLHTRYVGQKRFSLEGGEALIPLLDELIQRGGRKGIKEIVIGMAHRGRLNVLTNILGKPPHDIFDEFEGRFRRNWRQVAGDVKYHLGFSTDVDTPGGLVHLALGFNPSHLEIIGPVIEGSVRARQDRRRDRSGEQVLPVIIHGDAAIAGQGVVMETFNLSQVRGFATGGTVHIVINNQIGFTTSNPLDTRSTLYCTDVAKMVQAPVFHVNGDDPEAVIFVTRMALDFRNQFRKDVVIDLVCYRRLGHNEADEPSVTQPMMYKKIRAHPTARAVYGERLVEDGVLGRDEVQRMAQDYRSSIEQGVVVARPVVCGLDNAYRVDWKSCNGTDVGPGGEHRGGNRQAAGPGRTDAGGPGRLRVAPAGSQGLVRAGQDGRRRPDGGLGLCREPGLCHAGGCWLPGAPVRPGLRARDLRPPPRRRPQPGGRRQLHAAAAPGDPPGRVRRHRLGPVRGGGAGLRVRLCHRRAQRPGPLGGPVRRLRQRRPGGHRPVHHLRRNQVGPLLRPGHAVAPRARGPGGGALLGAPGALPATVCGAQHPGLRPQQPRADLPPAAAADAAQLPHPPDRDDPQEPAAPSPRGLGRRRAGRGALPAHHRRDRSHRPRRVWQRVVFCSGKVYYDLLEARRGRGLTNVAIVRIEQLYPFPKEQFAAAIAAYPDTHELIWCQEEALNQGAWDQIKHRFHSLIQDGKQIYYVGRPASAAPAVGHRQVHVEQQERLIDEALTGRINPNMNRRIPL